MGLTLHIVARRALMRLLLTVLFALLSAGAPVRSAQAEDIVIIVNKDNPHPVDTTFITRVYMGTLKGWPDGSPVIVLDQTEGSDAREVFCATVLKKSVPNVKAIWSQNIFTGKGLPPKVATPDQAIKEVVAANKGAIGYIRASQVDATVKVVGR
jgi:ABC-type phosphate transport system substrate-binding protein